MRILDDDGKEQGSIIGHPAASPQAATRDLLRKYKKLLEQSRLQRKPVDLADDLKGPSHRLT
jgi:hypothetical protein